MGQNDGQNDGEPLLQHQISSRTKLVKVGAAAALVLTIFIVLVVVIVLVVHPSKGGVQSIGNATLFGRNGTYRITIRNGLVFSVEPEENFSEVAGIDARGSLLLPGFLDAHTHLIASALELQGCNLYEARNEGALLATIATCAARMREQDGSLLLGVGWSLEQLGDRMPTASLLDTYCADIPVVLTSVDGHSVWVNTAALALANISRDTPDPFDGEIVRDFSGNPTGYLLEGAIALMDAVIPPPTHAQLDRALMDAQKLAHAFGITGVVEANTAEAHARTFVRARQRGTLKLRVSCALSLDHVSSLVALRESLQQQSGWDLRFSSVKIFLDGVVETETAFMFPGDYLGGGMGIPQFSDEMLERTVRPLVENDFQIHFHAIGNAAVRQGLKVLQDKDSYRLRHHMAHLQFVNETEFDLFERYHVTPNFQPFWFVADYSITNLTSQAVGPQLAMKSYPMASVSRGGVATVCGSDWSVSSMDPLLGIHGARFRGAPQAPLNTAEDVSAQLALDCYTKNSARIMFMENQIGSIEPGKVADLVILSTPSLESDSYVTTTIFGGEIVFQKQ